MPHMALSLLQVRARPGARSRGVLIAGRLAIPVVLGRTGIRANKREGDGATPRGWFHLRRLWWRADRNPRPATLLAIAGMVAASYAGPSPWDLGAPGLPGNGAEPDRPAGARWAEPAADDELAEEAGVVPIQMEGDGPVVVREKFHAAAPVSVDQALFEMELVGHDFYLFRDQQCGLPSVVYRRHGYQYGLIRLVEQTQPDVAANGGLKF